MLINIQVGPCDDARYTEHNGTTFVQYLRYHENEAVYFMHHCTSFDLRCHDWYSMQDIGDTRISFHPL